MSDQVTRPIEEPPSPPPPTVPSFQPLPPVPPAPPPRKGMSIWLILLIIVLLCAVVCCCLFIALTMLGPSIGNVFSNILEELPATP